MHPLYTQYQTTLLGRLKIQAQSRLTGSLEEVPSQYELFTEVFKRWKENPLAGRFYSNLLDCSTVHRMDFPARLSARAVRAIMAKMRLTEYFARIYAEGHMLGELGSPEYGCLILGSRLEDGSAVYHAIVLRDSDIDHCNCCMLTAGGVRSAERISLLTTDGWIDFTPGAATNYSPVRAMLTTLSAHLDKVGPRSIPVENIKVDLSNEPPYDPELMRRLHAVYNGRMTVATATISLASIIPNSLDFCLQLPPSGWKVIARRVCRGFRPVLAVYWDGSRFIMSDDHGAYLAYKKAGSEKVPVAILGEFPPHAATAERVGGPELLPPVEVKSEVVYPTTLTEEYKAWSLNERVQCNEQNAIPGDLIAKWMAFADLLHNEQANEKDLHDFIIRYPEVLTVYGARFEREVRLGEAYRIDIMVRSSGVKDEVTLVELEHHRHEVFTQEGQTRAEITHAIQQVQDWFRWIRENPNNTVSASLAGIPPRGLVVAGRSRNFTEDQRSRLAHLNSTSPVLVITYDELLSRFGDLILSRLDTRRS